MKDLNKKRIKEQKGSYIFCRLFLVVSLMTLLGMAKSFAQKALISGGFSKVGDTDHLSFSGLSQWPYDLKKVSDKKIILTLPAMDDATITKVSAWRGTLVETVSLDKNGPDDKFVVTLKLADNVEVFDYLTDDPSRLIVDFYVDPDKKEATAKKKSKNNSGKKVANTKAKEAGPKYQLGKYIKKDRSPAGTENLQIISDNTEKREKSLYPKAGVYDAGDSEYERFGIKDYEIKEEAIIASAQNIYIKFPMLKMKVSRLDELMSNPPEYVIHPKETKENEEARFLMHLYNKKRFAAFLKTYDYFRSKYPQSVYTEIVENMAAEVHYGLFLRDKHPQNFTEFYRIYKKLVSQYPNSPLAERNDLVLAYTHLAREDGIETLRNFQRILKKSQDSQEYDNILKAIADGYLFLKKPQDALRIYEKLEKTAKVKSSSIEARYRRGDVFFKEGRYQEAMNAYINALKEYPKHGFEFPNALYNLAESYFWKGEYKKSIKSYVEFMKRFPLHEHGGFAMTRIGELLEIMGADRTRVMAAFLESYFRFRKSPGSEVSRIRLLSQRFKGMRPKEVAKSLEEMKEIVANSKLPRINEFTNLMIADGYHRREEYKNSLDTLVSYYQKNPTSSNLEFFRKRILRNIADVIKVAVDKRDFLDSLKVYGFFIKTWLRNSDRMDVPYFMGRTYEMAGVLDESHKIYKGVLKDLYRIRGTREEKERRVNEHLPTIDQVELRLAHITFMQRDYSETLSHLKKIKGKLYPQEQIEKISLQAKVSIKKGNYKKAKGYLTQLIEKWEKGSEHLVDPYSLLAQVNYKMRNYNEALVNLAQLETLKASGIEISEDNWAKNLELKAEAYVKVGKPISAIQAYQSLLDEFENKRPLSSVRYKVGKILFDKGDVKGAEKVWNPLETKNKLYYQLAKEQLSNAQWSDEYKKYLKRIPATTTKLERR